MKLMKLQSNYLDIVAMSISIPKSHFSLLTSPFGFKISNLAFVDDLLFAKTSTKGARNILGILDKFAKVCGQQINFHKSSLYFSLFLSGL
ncbi:unnamed protein product [Malus baccata var. baccata]